MIISLFNDRTIDIDRKIFITFWLKPLSKHNNNFDNELFDLNCYFKLHYYLCQSYRIEMFIVLLLLDEFPTYLEM